MFTAIRRFVARSKSLSKSNSRFRPRIEPLEARVVCATLTQSGFTETLIGTGISGGTAIELAPNGDLWVLQQTGQVKRIRPGGNPNTPDVVGNLSGLGLNSAGERGVLGIAFDPNYAVNKQVFIYYTATSPNIHNRISRFTVNDTAAADYFFTGTTSGGTAGTPTENIVFELDALSGATNHNGGAIHFGPDGKLYVAVGDNATGSNAQSLTTLHGKMLRINADGTVPSDNPFHDGGGPNRDAIWALGLRNPFTFTIQPGTGVMYINDVGQNAFEEINVGAAGANYGWPGVEGVTGTPPSSPGTYRPPLYFYGRSGPVAGFAITGGAFYDPTVSRFPASYAGDYFFADYVNDWIMVRDASGTVTSFATDARGCVDLKVGPDGYLYYLARDQSGVYRVDFTGVSTPTITQEPADRTASIGLTASFTVSASGTGLSYQWQRAPAGTTNFTNVSGATAATYNLTVLAADDGARFRAVVTNANGSATSNFATLTATPNQPPTPVIEITGGLRNGRFDAGASITFGGTVVDPEEGAVPLANWTWQVDYISSIDSGAPVVRPFIPAFSAQSGGQMVPATTGPYTLADVAYRISLTAVDSQGNSRTVVTDLLPNTATITLATNPAGLTLTRDGQPVTGPSSFVSVVGFIRPYGVPPRQELNGVTYDFASWSDGGAATHNVPTPQTNTTYTATFVVAPVQVSSQVVSRTGVRVLFTEPLRTDALNVIDYVDATGQSVLGPADVQLIGASAGPIAGSLLVDADARGMTFVATRGFLPPDSYTLMLRSAANGLRNAAGNLLDGDQNGSPGGDYVSTFTVTAPAANEVAVRVPHFVRGPGQPVNTPAESSLGLPVLTESASPLSALSFELAFDPALFAITAATLPADAPSGSAVVFTALGAGRVRVAITYGSPLAAGSRTAVYLTAAVPLSAANRYGERQLLDLTAVQPRDAGGALLSARDGDGLQVNAYFGDVGRNGDYDSFDVQQASRMAVRLDGGFLNHPLLDPVVIGDFNANGLIDSLDVQRLSRLALRLPVTETPPLPNPLPPVSSAGGVVDEGSTPSAKRADVDGNGAVDAQDVLWTVYHLNQSTDAATAPQADLNADGTIDPVDVLLAIWDYEQAERERGRL